MLRNIACIEDTIKDTRVQQFIKKRYEVTIQVRVVNFQTLIIQLVEDWLLHPSTDPKLSVSVHASAYPNQEESLRTIHAFLVMKRSSKFLSNSV